MSTVANASDFAARPGEELLSPEEIARRWVAHTCDKHGFLVATTSNAQVSCQCGLVARRLRNGRIVGDNLRPTTAKARAENRSGHPVLYLCGECGEDFGGKTLQRRHRAGGRTAKRCLSPVEMAGRGWHQDARGRWRDKAPVAAFSG